MGGSSKCIYLQGEALVLLCIYLQMLDMIYLVSKGCLEGSRDMGGGNY